ncbi:MAG: cobamide remodeling phosphodiesterase CbiR [Spirochaetota bacterium]|nr:cobamide remodeling phosphodiesterase CbiR [Spirochaetota bacterium]
MELPFRIGTTSYIYPDEIIPNVHRLKDRVNDIELLFFEVNDEADIPSVENMKELLQISRDSDLTYTPHLPVDLHLGSNRDLLRESSIDKVVTLINHLYYLQPHCYVLHLNLMDIEEIRIDAWQKRISDSLQSILNKTVCKNSEIGIENINYPFWYIEDIIADNNLSICIDVGHLIVAGADVEKHLNKYLNKTKVIHLHGVYRDRDHQSLRYMDRKLLKKIWNILNCNNYDGILTLEIFSESNFEESISIIEELL